LTQIRQADKIKTENRAAADHMCSVALEWLRERDNMGKFFNLDSLLMRFLTRLADMMILNLAFLISCIPVVTVGAAWTALYYVALKMVRDEEGSILRSYFHSFRQNFRQATVLWLGVLAVVGLLIFDRLILAGMDSPVAAAMNGGTVILGVALLMVLQYLFPLLSKFDDSLIRTLKNACLLALGELPRTLLMVGSAVGALVITFYNGYTLSIGILVWMLLGFAIMAFSNSCILIRIFDKMISAKTEEVVEQNG